MFCFGKSLKWRFLEYYCLTASVPYPASFSGVGQLFCAISHILWFWFDFLLCCRQRMQELPKPAISLTYNKTSCNVLRFNQHLKCEFSGSEGVIIWRRRRRRKRRERRRKMQTKETTDNQSNKKRKLELSPSRAKHPARADSW